MSESDHVRAMIELERDKAAREGNLPGAMVLQRLASLLQGE